MKKLIALSIILSFAFNCSVQLVNIESDIYNSAFSALKGQIKVLNPSALANLPIKILENILDQSNTFTDTFSAPIKDKTQKENNKNTNLFVLSSSIMQIIDLKDTIKDSSACYMADYINYILPILADFKLNIVFKDFETLFLYLISFLFCLVVLPRGISNNSIIMLNRIC
jgi:hypothetical protein